MNGSNNAIAFGFRIVGPCTNERRLIDWPSAFGAYSRCDERAEANKESYLSAFHFGDAFADHLETTGTTKGYARETWSDWLWFDIDREDDIDAATLDARKLVTRLSERYQLPDEALLIFFSGSKGFHIGLPLSVCGSPEPSVTFHAVCRRLAESIAKGTGVMIDTKVYDRVRAFRAPNSTHPKTGRHKRFLTFDELMGLKASRIVELAELPEAFDLPAMPEASSAAVADWSAAVSQADESATVAKQRRSVDHQRDALNRSTMSFIRDGATSDRAVALFSSAANLAEFGFDYRQAFAVLSEAALDSGLSPSEVRRQIECGLDHKGGGL